MREEISMWLHGLGDVFVSYSDKRISVGHLVDQCANTEYVSLAVVALEVTNLRCHEWNLTDGYINLFVKYRLNRETEIPFRPWWTWKH